MKNLTLSLLLLTVLIGANSCKETPTVDLSKYEALAAEHDSLKARANDEHQSFMQLNDYINQVAECIDSISQQGNLMALNRDPETGRKYSRREVIERLNGFSRLIQRQREQIAMLTDSLNNSDSPEKIAHLTGIIEFLNSQLAEKEVQIEKLRAEVSSNRRSIESLNTTITGLNETNKMLETENKTLDRAYEEQTNITNEGYFLAATKKELEDLGLISGNLFKKKFNPENIRLSVCQKIDQRSFNDIPLSSRKPKLLTQAPAGSYTFETQSNGQSMLVILDTVAFWSLSNIVIIQL